MATFNGHFILLFLSALQFLVNGQHFDTKVEDRDYLDNVQTKVDTHLETATQTLIQEGSIMEGITERFVHAKMKQNLFSVSQFKISNLFNLN